MPAGPGAVARIVALVGEYEPIELVVGLPRSLSGGEGPAAATVPVAQVAELVVRGRPAAGPAGGRAADHGDRGPATAGGGRSAKKQRSRIDAAAAAAILEHALASERRRGMPPGELLSARTRPTSWASDPERGDDA